METDERTKRTRGSGSIYCRKGCESLPCGHTLWIKFYLPGSKPVRLSAKTDKLNVAEKQLQQRLAQVRTNQFFGAKAERTTIGDLYDDLHTEYQLMERKSIRFLECRWNEHLKADFGNVLASDVSKDSLSKYAQKRLNQGAAHASVNRELAILKRAMKLGMPDKVRVLPLFPHLSENNVRTGFLTDEEFARLAATCAREGLWLRAMLECGYRLGWRSAELRGLRVSQIDLLNGVIVLRPGTTKNKDGRTGPITATMRPYIEACWKGKDANAFLFSRDPKGRFGMRDFRGSWQRACCAAGVGKMLCRKCGADVTAQEHYYQCEQCGARVQVHYQGLIFHDLRRCACRNMLRSNIAQVTAMKISGHRTASIFNRYAIVAESDLLDAGRKLDARAEQVALRHTAEALGTDMGTTAVPLPIPADVKPN